MNTKAKKAIKITVISLGSLLGLVIIAIALVCWTVFTPSRLTKVAQKAIEKYSPARAKVDNVDLTLVKSYPFLGFPYRPVCKTHYAEGLKSVLYVAFCAHLFALKTEKACGKNS